MVFFLWYLKFTSVVVMFETHCYHYITKLECGPMPNLMIALPNIGGALCSMPQSLADAHHLTAVQ